MASSEAPDRQPALNVPLPRLVQPSVSIVICNYNYGHFLARAVTSACEQSYPSQVVVVDDGSTDNSLEILENFRDQVRVIVQPNSGQRAAYQTGFENSSGDVVIFLDADDYLFPEAVAESVRAFDHGVAKVHFRLRLVNGEDDTLGVNIPHNLGAGNVGRRLSAHGILYSSAPGSGNVYRRAVLERLFPLPRTQGDRHGGDFFLTYASALFGSVGAVQRELGAYRVHDKGQVDSARSRYVFGNAASNRDQEACLLERGQVFAKWIAERSDAELRVPEQLVDFSQLKSLYAVDVLEDGYVDGVRRGVGRMPGLLRALWLKEDFALSKKLGLTGWALLVLAAPQPWAAPLARYVVDPASR